MRERVIRTVSEVMGVPEEQIGDDASPDTLEPWDSLKHMQLVMALEDELGVQFPVDAIPELLTFGAIEEMVAQLAAG